MSLHWLETAAVDVEKFFTKFWKNAPAWNVKALSLVNATAPEAEMVLSLVDPEVAKEVNPVINEVQADMGTLATVLKSGNTSNLPALVGSIKANLSSLLTEAHIKDQTSRDRATGIVNGISAALTSVLSLVPTAA